MIPLGRRLVSPARLSLRDARNLGERAFAFLTAADAVICQCTRANGSVPRYRDAKEPPQGFLSSFAPTVKGLELQEEDLPLRLHSGYVLQSAANPSPGVVACIFVEGE